MTEKQGNFLLPLAEQAPSISKVCLPLLQYPTVKNESYQNYKIYTKAEFVFCVYINRTKIIGINTDLKVFRKSIS